MDGWNTTFLLGRPIFRGQLLVSGSVYTCIFGFSDLPVLIADRPHEAEPAGLEIAREISGPRCSVYLSMSFPWQVGHSDMPDRFGDQAKDRIC